MTKQQMEDFMNVKSKLLMEKVECFSILDGIEKRQLENNSKCDHLFENGCLAMDMYRCIICDKQISDELIKSHNK